MLSNSAEGWKIILSASRTHNLGSGQFYNNKTESAWFNRLNRQETAEVFKI